MLSSTKTSNFTPGTGLPSSLRMVLLSDRQSDCGTFHVSSQSFITDSAFNSRLGGTAYTDVLHIYGMNRAGYIPQMFSLRLPNPIVIFELLQKTGACALVCEPSFCVDLSGCPVPNYSAIQVRD